MATENYFSMSDNIKLSDFNIISLQRPLTLLDTTTSPTGGISMEYHHSLF